MGYDKFRLPLGEQTFLEHVISRLLETVDGPIIAASSQQTAEEVENVVSSLANTRVQSVVDREDAGPMEGIRSGLKKASEFSEWAFVTSCDVPLFVGEVLRVLCDSMAEDDATDLEAVIPLSGSRVFGMTALYRCSIHEKIETMLSRNRLRVSELSSELKAKTIDLDELRKVDPKLDSVRNLNSPEQYFRFLEEKGFDCPPEIEAKLNSLPE